MTGNWSKDDRAEELARIIEVLGGKKVSIYEVIGRAERVHDVSPTEVERALDEALGEGLVYYPGSRDRVSALT